MLARIRPAAKIGHVIEGPTDHIRLDPKKKSLVLIDSSPALPVMENLGNRSAVATPTRAVAAREKFADVLEFLEADYA